MITLGKMKRITDLRAVWSHEAHDFTKWLAEESNLQELSDAIGIDINLEERESSVGNFNVDLYATENGTGRKIIIENQLERTNHDHLGKSITYASALNAKTIVWIAPDFTEEHKKALDWLNDNTNEDLAFWGIQLELWQITEDTASMRLNIVSTPSTNVKTLKTKTNSESESRNTQLAFWTKFRDKLLSTKKFSSLQTPQAHYWYDIRLGRSGITLSNTCNTQKNVVGVRVYISGRMVDAYFPALLSRKAEINKALGCEPEWDPNPTAKDKTIALTQNTDLSDPAKVEETLDWMVRQTLIFHSVFSKEIKSI